MNLHRIALVLVASACAFGFDAKSDVLANLDATEKKFVSLAEAVPADKYGWRPMEGVRSVGEVYMHVAIGNYTIPSALGAKSPIAVTREMETTITDKAQIIEHLKKSFTHLRQAVTAVTDPSTPTKLFGRDSTHGGAQLAIVSHLHEHLGQSIAYARSNKVTPPWSAGRD